MLNSGYRLWMAGLLIFLALNGCAIRQERDMRRYREVLGIPGADAQEPFSPEEPLTLKQAMNLANAQNEKLAIAGEDYLQTLINKDRAFSSFLPTISFVPSFMRQKETSLGAGNSLISEFVPTEATDSAIEGSMDLNPLHDALAVRSAKASAEVKRAMLLERQAVILLEIAETYFQILHSEKQVDVLKHTARVRYQQLEEIQVKERVGMVRPMDVQIARATSAKTENRLIQAENDVKNGRAMLAYLIGVPEVDGPLATDLRIPSTRWPTEDLLKTACARRQDLIAARKQVKAAAASLEAAWGEYFPSVSLNLSYYLERDTFPSDVDWTSLIRIHVPIFSAGLIHADVRTAYSRLRQARLVETDSQRLVLRDLKVVVENLQKDDRQIEQLNIQVEAADETLRQMDEFIKAGMGTSLDRMVAQDEVLSAELMLCEAEFSRNIDYMKLLRVTGSLKPDFSVSISISDDQTNK